MVERVRDRSIESRQSSFRLILLLLSIAFIISIPRYETCAQSAPVLLERGKPIERQIAGGEAHNYRVALAAGQFLLVVVDQRGIDLVVSAFDAEGRRMVEVDSPNGAYGPETVSIVTESAGSYRLEVRSLDKIARAGSYEIKTEELRAATPRDSAQVLAERSFAEAEILRWQGTAQGLRKAIEKYKEAIPILQRAGNQGREALSLHAIGWIYDALGEKQKALDYYNLALGLMRKAGDQKGEALTLSSLGSVYDTMGDKKKAMEYYNLALPLRQAAGDRRGEAATLANIGTVYISLGERRKALEYYNLALPLHRETVERRGEAAALANMGAAHDALGEKQKALEYYEKALTITEEIGDKRAACIILSNIGSLYSSLGEKQKAMGYHEKALLIIRQTGDKQGEAFALSNIGSIYDALGEKQKAMEYYNLALPLRRASNDRRGEAITLNSIGSIYFSMGDNQKAMEYYDHALRLRRATGDRPEEAVTLNNIGLVYNSMGEVEKALDYQSQALLLNKEVGDRSNEAKTLYIIAQIEMRRGNLSEASSSIASALDIVESLRAKVASPELRASYLASVHQYYGLYISLLMRLHRLNPGQGNDAMALHLSERERARTLLELLTEARADIRQGADPALLERERSLKQSLDAKSERQTRLLGGRHTPQQASEIKKEIEQLLTEHQEVQARIRYASPRYAALTQPRPLGLKEIQQELLDSETLLLEYALGEEKSFVWAVTLDSMSGFELPGRAEIEKAAQRLYELLTAHNRRAQGESLTRWQARRKREQAEYLKAAAELSRMILGPVSKQLSRKRLLIVSDGALNYVPFAALPSPKSLESGVESLKSGRSNSKDSGLQTPDSGLPLIENHEIISLPSASALAVLRREMASRSPAPKSLVVLADPVFDMDDDRLRRAKTGRPQQQSEHRQSERRPSDSSDITLMAMERSAREAGLGGAFPRLPFTRREAETIYDVAGGDARKALDFDASKAAAISPQMKQYRIVHFATHGLLNNEHPELSGLVFSLINSEGREQNGFVRLFDIYNLELNAELVVLSACRTALGKQVHGEGIVGLTRGFMYAGAARVMTSLWKVDDEATAELMKKFYEGVLKENVTPAAALRAAQIWMHGQKRWRSPYYWAGFVLQGEWK